VIELKLAVFDFNGTLFPKETIPFLISCWKKFGYSKLNLYKLYIIMAPLIIKYRYPFLTTMSIEEMKVQFMYKFVKIFKGMEQEEIEKYFQKVENEAHQYYKPEVIKRLEEFKEKDYEIVLLSGTFEELLEKIRERLEVDNIIGSSILKDREDELDDFSVLSGSIKLKALKKEYSSADIDWDKSYAFADSIDDLSLLQAVGHPVAVNPEKGLKVVAQSEDWQIID
jgi:HAD superfamily phosphoserine phosphatase-like hydrolase